MRARPAIVIAPERVGNYCFSPGILPRLNALFLTGFGVLAQLTALLFYLVRLLPRNHRFFDPRFAGRFSVISVFAETANRIVLSRRNIDQIILFFAVLLTVGLLVAYIVGGIIALALQPAMAATPLDLFTAPNPSEDLAFQLMNTVFGVPGIFGSDAIQIKSVHIGLHAMLRFYSNVIFLLAFLLFLYHLVSMVYDTTQTGTPFGKQFHSIWAPLRLIVAFGLLLPFGAQGLNSGQYLVLYMAKFGSSFATNAWGEFVDQTRNVYGLGMPSPTESDTVNRFVVVDPEVPNMFPLYEFTQSFWVCKLGYETILNRSRTQLPVLPRTDPAAFPIPQKLILPYLVKAPDQSQSLARGATNFTFDQALTFTRGRDLVIRFGHHSPTEHAQEVGFVKPYCGELVIPVSNANTIGAREVYKGYYDFIVEWVSQMQVGWGHSNVLFAERMNRLGDMGAMRNPAFANSECPYDTVDEYNDVTGEPIIWDDDIITGNADYTDLGKVTDTSSIFGVCMEPVVKSQEYIAGDAGEDADVIIYDANGDEITVDAYFQAQNESGYVAINSQFARFVMSASIREAREAITESDALDISAQIRSYGWAGAGITAQSMARINGALVAATSNLPYPRLYPQAMELVKEARLRADSDINIDTVFDPALPSGTVDFALEGEDGIARALYANYRYWRDNTDGLGSSGEAARSGNALIDLINDFMGFQGLVDLACNRDLHPMAYISVLGKALVEKGIRHFMISTGVAVGGGFGAGLLTDVIGAKKAGAIRQLSGFFVMIASIGLASGFVMYYIIPFLPFMYFFFAVGVWIKGIFEALVAVPLWALAHVQVDGNGLPGREANAGYMLILEIFVRPFLTTVGFIAAMTIFAAMVFLLNKMMPLYSLMSGIGNPDCGFDFGDETLSIDSARSAVDQLFFTIVYVIIVYMTGLSCFKLIDMIPDLSMRWIGSSTQSFGQLSPDTESQFVGYTVYTANTGFQGIVEGVNTAASGLSQQLGRMGASGTQQQGGG